jgi:phytoene dehydrogenase-like protein
MPGVYMCGACTHPGGSVIAINGRNAAMAVLADSLHRTPTASFPDRNLRTADTLG